MDYYREKVRPKIGLLLGTLLAINGVTEFTRWFDDTVLSSVAYAMNLSGQRESENIIDLRDAFEKKGYPPDLWSPLPPERAGNLKILLALQAEQFVERKKHWQEESMALLHRAGRFAEEPLFHLDDMQVEVELLLAFDESLNQ